MGPLPDQPPSPVSGFKIFSQSRIAADGGAANQGHGLQVISPALQHLSRTVSSATIKANVHGGADDSDEEDTKAGALVRRASQDVSTVGRAQPSATSQALIKYATGSTLLPQNIASLITSLSLLARVSLRSTAFFAEVILEAAKFSTSTSLGLTRRALISAIGSARALHDTLSADGGGAWDAKAIGSGSSAVSRLAAMRDQHDGFLAVLDKYTAVGIYVIHHTFTMAELFAMSSFYLVDSGIKAGISAADESVRMVDGIFGSNETSRALSSFIGLVRRELAHGTDDGAGKLAGIKALASLTKAFTAFAVLQNATYKRTARNHKMQVLYDCTVLGEVESNSWRSMIVGPGNFVKKAQEIAPPPRTSSALLSSSPMVSPSKRSFIAGADHRGSLRPSHSHYGGSSLCLTDVGSDAHYEQDDYESVAPDRRGSLTSSLLPPSSDLEDDENDLVRDLSYLIGSEAEEEQAIPHPAERGHGSEPMVRRTIRRRNPVHGTIETVYEEVTETIETTETTTISGGRSTKTSRLPMPFGVPQVPARAKSRSANHSEAWTEIGTGAPRTADDSDDDMLIERELVGEHIPQAPNGLPAESIGTLSRRRALDRPDESKARMQVVLKTITRKLVQKRKVVRRTEGSNSLEDDVFSEGTVASDAERPPSKQRQVGRPDRAVSSESHASASGSPKGKSRALQSLFSRASKAGPRITSSAMVTSSRSPSPPSSPPAIAMSPATPEKPLPQAPIPAPAPPLEDTPKSRLALKHRNVEEEEIPKPRRRARQPSITSMRSFASARKETHTTTSSTSAAAHKYEHGQFPQQPFVKNLHTFMRHSSAAYGQNFMRIFGIGRSAEYLFADTQKHHSNIWAYAHHVGIPVDNILLSSYTEGETTFHSEQMSPIVNYISVDDEAKAVVLTCRGSMGLSDILTDLTCDYEEISVQGGEPGAIYQVHSGMWASAIRMSDVKSTIHATLKEALESRPDYGLVLTGHSLGGGVAALLAVMWSSRTEHFHQQRQQQADHLGSFAAHSSTSTRFVTSFTSGLPPGRPIHVYAYGPPAIGSIDLSHYCSGLVTSVVHGHDIVPSISLGTVRDMRNVAESLSEDTESKMAQEIVGTVVGLYQRKRKAAAQQGQIADSDEVNFPRPPEPPVEEREQILEPAEILQGRTRNRALDSGYQDPILKESKGSADTHADASAGDPERDTNDWLWSLMTTLRAAMGETKLYPPGDVFCIESFTVYVTPRTARRGSHVHGMDEDAETSMRGEAHRVLLRACQDVEKRFSEPIFARSMLRDHIPTNYELCTQLLYESVAAGEGDKHT